MNPIEKLMKDIHDAFPEDGKGYNIHMYNSRPNLSNPELYFQKDGVCYTVEIKEHVHKKD